MHIFFSGIGGAGIAPLALIAKQAGFEVSGSDKQDSQYIHYLNEHEIDSIHIGQSKQDIELIHKRHPIDWYVYSSAISIENPDMPEISYCIDNQIRISKRDELLNYILKEKGLSLIAVAGTHGKTTTTAMLVWLFKNASLPLSYLLPAKTNFAELGKYDEKSQYFVYEADEFDHNFLSFHPQISLITGVSWDHHEQFPTLDSYKAAFNKFVSQSSSSILWQKDIEFLKLDRSKMPIRTLDYGDPRIDKIELLGKYNRQDGWLAIQAIGGILKRSNNELIDMINAFPGLARRMERIKLNLYTDYAHTPEKIRGAISAATETAAKLSAADPKTHSGNVVIVYEPLTDRRQHYIGDSYLDCFEGSSKVYWLPSYLAREDPSLPILRPEELIAKLSDPSLAEPMKRDATLKQVIDRHLGQGDTVVALAGGGGNSLDDWLRLNYPD